MAAGHGSTGGESIIRDESIGTGGQSDVADEVPECLGRSPVEPAAMHVNNRGPLSGLRRPGPPAGYAPGRSGYKGDALWDSDSLHDAVERTAASDPFELAFHWRDNRSQSSHSDRIFLAERMYNQRPSAPVFLRKLDCIVLSSQITFREGRNRREKRRDALPPRIARLSESFNSELCKMCCLEFTARSRRRYGKSVPYRT